LSNGVGTVKTYEFLRFFSVKASIYQALTVAVDLISAPKYKLLLSNMISVA
jgi:hypothetical protein